MLPWSMASEGSAHIGGNIATNAGGVRFVRFGGIRRWLLGLEIVTGSGTILQLGGSVRKDQSGYDLKSLLVGSEGTLGIITQVELAVPSRPLDSVVCVLGATSLTGASELRSALLRDCPNLLAIETYSLSALQKVREHKALPALLSQEFPFYYLIELEITPIIHREHLETFLAHFIGQFFCADGVIAQNSKQAADLWRYREEISETLSRHCWVRKNDISLPIECLSEYLNELNEIVDREKAPVELVLFGHIGDGNLHVNFTLPRATPAEKFSAALDRIEDDHMHLVERLNGSISAEHGIGILKKKFLRSVHSPEMNALFRQIKSVFDPHGILSPGKLLADFDATRQTG